MLSNLAVKKLFDEVNFDLICCYCRRLQMMITRAAFCFSVAFPMNYKVTDICFTLNDSCLLFNAVDFICMINHIYIAIRQFHDSDWYEKAWFLRLKI